ncbi:glycosyltransferase [Motilibacter peucedani]|nr:glycosyltransferase [Motilibacter peucedani]
MLDYPQSRSVADVARNAVAALRRVPLRRTDVAVSTGANLAVSVLPFLVARGVPVHYIESATRVTGPSASGRIIAALPRVNLYAQYESWATGRWGFGGTVFDGYAAEAGEPRAVKKVVVTLGSSEGYGFRRVLERLVQVLPPEVEVLWQTGVTDVSGLPIDARASMPARELADAVREADVVVAHAGTGSSLGALQNGKLPVLVPRRAAFGEHVDDHQQQIADMLSGRGLALVREADQVSLADLEQAAGASVHEQASPPPFRLKGTS